MFVCSGFFSTTLDHVTTHRWSHNAGAQQLIHWFCSNKKGTPDTLLFDRAFIISLAEGEQLFKAVVEKVEVFQLISVSLCTVYFSNSAVSTVLDGYVKDDIALSDL